MLLPQELLRLKRDGGELPAEAIRAFVAEIATGAIGDAQLGAFAMAVCLCGMSAAETVALTLAMRDGGRRLDWDDLPGPTVDKHSTGGVGDKVSLILAPVLAACGAYVPMLSGRGLGHTGGTLDKLESIAGYAVAPDLARLRAVLRRAGCAIVGAGADLAPADARLYAVRDVTATVESIPLVTASILAKKLAGGAGALVMDVKTGSGAFLPEPAAARALARSIVAVARGAGLPCTAYLTDMGECLGTTAGNALEVEEALAVLRGEPADARLVALVETLGAEALVMAGLAADPAEALARLRAALGGGHALERFARMVEGLGGEVRLIEAAGRLPRAPVVLPVAAPRDGVVAAIDVRALGMAVVRLGGGRRRLGERIDHRVGLGAVRGRGVALRAGEPLALVHAADAAAAEREAVALAAAFTLADAAPPPPPVVGERLAVDGAGASH